MATRALQFSPVEHMMSCPTCGQIYTLRLPASMTPEPQRCDECSSRAHSTQQMTAEEMAELRWSNAVASLEVPRRFLSITRDTAALGSLAEWNGDPWCLAFAGQNGVGKTWQSIRLLAEVRLRSGAPCLYVEAAEFLEKLKQEFDGSERGLMDVVSKVPFLCVDDIGQERSSSEFAQERLSLLLRRRYNDQLGTIITTNADVRGKGFHLLGDAVRSRVAEGRIIPMTGIDRRARR